LRGTRKAKKRCILSIKIKNPENSVFFKRKRMLEEEDDPRVGGQWRTATLSRRGKCSPAAGKMLKKEAAGWEGPAAELLQIFILNAFTYICIITHTLNINIYIYACVQTYIIQAYLHIMITTHD
jgi:hypothetical protein